MKKLLSVLTISGTAVPTTIAASLYQKQETKLENSEINYSQENNLNILNRNKRSDKKYKRWLYGNAVILGAGMGGGTAAGAGSVASENIYVLEKLKNFF